MVSPNFHRLGIPVFLLPGHIQAFLFPLLIAAGLLWGSS